MKSKAAQADCHVWFDGKNINEALFCDEFLSTRKIVFSCGEFFTPDGRVTDDLPLRSEIYDALKCCACNNIPKKISNIIEVLKLSANADDFCPDTEHIHLANGTLRLDGAFTDGRAEIVRSRLPWLTGPTRLRRKSGCYFWTAFSIPKIYPPCRNISATVASPAQRPSG